MTKINTIWYIYFPPKCMEKCRWEYLASLPEHECVAPFMPLYDRYPECDDYERATSLFEMYQEWIDPGHVKVTDVIKLYMQV
jgi:hypothetical protein